jgi:hypothetical protein
LPDGTKVKLVQLLKSNLLLVPAVTTEDADQPGLKVSVAIPFSSPWTGADGGAASIVDQPDARTPWEFGSKNAGEFPFQVLVRSDPWEPDAYVFGVRDASLLLNSFDYEDTVDIDGLLVEDTGWVSWNGDFDLVWLELEWDDWPDSYTASIKSFSNGDEWESGEIETDGEDPPTQTKARIVLAGDHSGRHWKPSGGATGTYSSSGCEYLCGGSGHWNDASVSGPCRIGCAGRRA